ncbi:MAG: DUF4189 domain-containing protein [Pseudorhodoplanes sp.]|nr:DUF4189 domain-containing protein [Pseudorhodoplanes sp.]
MTIRRGLRAACLAAALLGGAAPAHAAAALAVGVTDSPADGIAYGWAINFKTVEEARKVALEKCQAFEGAPKAGKACKLIGAAEKHCLAMAFDPKDDSPGMGWAVEASRDGVGRARWNVAAPRRRPTGGTFARSISSSATAISDAVRARRSAQSEKLVPQPQDDLAFGLLILNAAPIRSST